jgi:hypothetical protein
MYYYLRRTRFPIPAYCGRILVKSTDSTGYLYIELKAEEV